MLAQKLLKQSNQFWENLTEKCFKKNNSKNYFIDRSTLEATSFLRALVEQNWIIIAQNEKIIKALNASDMN